MMPGCFHFIHDPVIVSAGLQGDLRTGRQLLQVSPILFSIMSYLHFLRSLAAFVPRHEHRVLLVRITSDKLLHIRCCSSFLGWGVASVWQHPGCSALIPSMHKSETSGPI